MTALLQSRQMESTAESLKRSQPVDPLPESEIKRIKITSLVQDTKSSSDPANPEKIQIKVISGNLTKVVTQQLNSPNVQEVEEKRTIIFDKKPSSLQPAPMSRNPSPPRSVQSSKGGQELSALLKGQHAKNQFGRSSDLPKPRERIDFKIWDSPEKSETTKSLDKRSPDKSGPKFSDHKVISRPGAIMQNRAECAASSTEGSIRLQFKGKGISMGRDQQSGLSAGKEGTFASAQSAASNFKSAQGSAAKGIFWPSF